MKKTSEVFGLPVISVLQGTQVGTVKDAVIDPVKKEVAAFVVKDQEWYKSVKVLPFNYVKSIGSDAVVVDKTDQVLEISASKHMESLARQSVEVKGSKVVSLGGKVAGKVSEFVFDEKRGDLAEIIVSSGGAPRSIPVSKVVTLGRDLVVVAEEGEESLAEEAFAEAEEEEEEEAETPEEAAAPEPTIEEEAPAASAYAEAAPEEALEEAPEEVPLAEETVEAPAPEPEAPEAVEKRSWAAEAEIEVEAAAPAKQAAPEEAAPVEAAPEAPAPQEAPAAAEPTGDMGSRQDSFLVGKKATKDIVADDGTVIVSAGETITSEVIERAKEAKKFLMLSFWVER